ncbi:MULTISPECIES: hypothetical protein [Rhodobacterales]|nr:MULTISPECIES: hypothetical protein [Rhodobacterales]MDO6589620.1 hypothetical protein [Yoonia sp. 1_MG-2023]
MEKYATPDPAAIAVLASCTFCFTLAAAQWVQGNLWFSDMLRTICGG